MQHTWSMTSRHRWTCSVCSHSFDWPWDDAPKLFGDDGGPDRLDPVWHKFFIRGVHSFRSVLHDVPSKRRFEVVRRFGLDPEKVSLHQMAFENCCLVRELQVEDVMES